MEAQRILLHHLEPAVFEEREGGGIRHVGMQHAGRTRIAQVDARVDVEGGFLDLPLALEHVAGAVEGQQVRGADLAPVQAVAVEEKRLPVRQHGAEVVADPLVQVESYRESERGGKVDAHRALDVPPEVLHRAHGCDYRGTNKKGARKIGRAHVYSSHLVISYAVFCLKQKTKHLHTI